MSIGFWQIIVILVLILLIFGTKKLRHFGEDLGAAIKGFKQGLGDAHTEENSEDKKKDNQPQPPTQQ